MRQLLLLFIITGCLISPVYAADFTVPQEPESAAKYMPDESFSFTKDLWSIFRSALNEVAPSISEVMNICASVIAIQLFIAVVQSFTGIAKKSVQLVGVIALSIILLAPSKALINTGIETIEEICTYNRLLTPVMTAALAAQGGTTTSAALYTGAVLLDTFLSIAVRKAILPMLYAYIALGIASVAIGEPILKRILDFLKGFIIWMMKITVYIFTGYMSITGIISGTVDAAALKATKMAVSGGIPVIGKIVSDASDTILLSAGIVKNTAGISGALVVLAIAIAPFLKIGTQYIMLKLTTGISSLYADKSTVSLVEHICTAMGFILAVTGIVCLLFLISIVCYLKGMN